MQKHGRTLSKVMGRGRQEPNKPHVSSKDLHTYVSSVLGDYDSYVKDSMQLYKSLMLLAPALVIANELPLTVKGLFSFKLVHTKSGKRRLKVSVSPKVSKYLDSGFYSDTSVMGILNGLLRIGVGKDLSVEEADYED